MPCFNAPQVRPTYVHIRLHSQKSVPNISKHEKIENTSEAILMHVTEMIAFSSQRAHKHGIGTCERIRNFRLLRDEKEPYSDLSPCSGVMTGAARSLHGVRIIVTEIENGDDDSARLRGRKRGDDPFDRLELGRERLEFSGRFGNVERLTPLPFKRREMEFIWGNGERGLGGDQLVKVGEIVE
jgi:hypothetical protein